MNSAAGTPLSETSPITMPRVLSLKGNEVKEVSAHRPRRHHPRSEIESGQVRQFARHHALLDSAGNLQLPFHLLLLNQMRLRGFQLLVRLGQLQVLFLEIANGPVLVLLEALAEHAHHP